MKVLMVSWEYPPVVVGGLGRHVFQLATALAAAGHEIVVLSRRPTNTDPSTHRRPMRPSKAYGLWPRRTIPTSSTSART
jgi:glycosyltransferase involved in cell wall biosynthesis